ncbi:low molecular weight protein-tyrosine-phosphatase [Wenyingzhuangia sp. 2_MG-2023]|uniref:low molecular weight protein-tyrosine-phosphatase n=1 Tax=Wenyingzhuangia sp. 2_MG-2023 TaxID=3062639 RepID=UPI0026E14433|nr:low molecular weight protein-tyrosine-phosphatase [Wenyingzhuangia sp. 2_MG-2023]MDO6736958.1 low molecular weight protein-tyrosine-phosphatase [Wenyingzhuangia sp. 2_MG-2023]
MKTANVLMVCLGNICRSPLAEGILKSKSNGLNIMVDSAGTGAYHVGNLPDARSILVAKQHGIDITDQRARKLEASDLDAFDFIYAMDESNYRNILMLAKNEAQKRKVSMIMNEVVEGSDISVPDPYYGGDQGFENVYQMLDSACDAILAKIKQ